MPESRRTVRSDEHRLTVFLSSTFRDMQEEREHLVKKIFPEIRRRCEERGVEFVEIDLRWGITAWQARRHRVLGICVEEIIRRRPIILTIIGDRFGWQPQRKDLDALRDLEERHPWLADAIEGGHSITEIEAVDIPMNITGMGGRVFCYARTKSVRRAPDLAEDEAREIDGVRRLRRRISDADFPFRTGYRTAARLGEWIEADLLALLEEMVPSDTVGSSLLLRERSGHEAFALSRRRSYVEHEPTIARLDRYCIAASEASPKGKRILPLVITGSSGSGKSSLLAWWSRRYAEENQEAIVLTHYVGATGSSTDPYGTLRRLMLELAEQTGEEFHPSFDPEAIVSEFPAALARNADRPIVIVIDALNQLDGGEELRWLPFDLPPHVRLLLSATPGTIMRSVEERGWDILQVNPMTKRERMRAIRSYLQRYGKNLESAHVGRIASHAPTSHPLFLRTTLEELRLNARFEEVGDHVDDILAVDSLENLYDQVLDRVEGDFGKEMTGKVLGALWGGREGLREGELQELTGYTVPQFRPLLHHLENHVVEVGGLLRVNHEYLRETFCRRYVGGSTAQRRHLAQVADWASSRVAEVRLAQTELRCRRESEDMAGFVRSLGNPELFETLWSGDTKFDLLRHWREIPTDPERSAVIRRWLQHARRQSGGGERLARLQKVAEFLRLAGRYHEAADLLEQIVSDGRSESREGESGWTGQLDLYLETLIEAGEYGRAVEEAEKGVSFREETFGKGSEEYAAALEVLGTALYYHRVYDRAERVLREALEHRRKKYGPDAEETATPTGLLGAVLYQQNNLEESEPLIARECTILRASLGPTNPRTLEAENNRATLLMATGRLAEARTILTSILETYRTLYGTIHPRTAQILTNAAHAASQEGDREAAIEMLKEAIAIDEMTLGPDHPGTAVKCTNIGTLYMEEDPAKAVDWYERALATVLQTSPENELAIAKAHLNAAGARERLGDESRDILETFSTYLPVKARLLGKNHPSTKLSQESLARIKSRHKIAP